VIVGRIHEPESAPRGEAKEEGLEGLMNLPGIGRSLANAIDHLAWSHRLPLLERLRGEYTPEQMFATVPGIGQGLARRLHDHLGIETLAELEAAAHDGRLAQVPGMGNKRIQAVRESLAGRFHPRWRRAVATQGDQDQVPVKELLEVDGEYRRLAAQGRLLRIAPRRFNPTGEAWLPVLHTQRGTRHYTALFSNTARAHEFGTTHDWVVIYRDDDDHGRWTVITAQYGRLRGHRIVRGREPECVRYYATAALPTPTGHAMAT
jgi:DNA polymerase (family 10)